jgi:hypothetical protein
MTRHVVHLDDSTPIAGGLGMDRNQIPVALSRQVWRHFRKRAERRSPSG